MQLIPTTIYFTWRPPANGLRWVQARPVMDDWKIGKDEALMLAPVGMQMIWKDYGREEDDYEPLTEFTALFRTLAGLEQTPDAIAEFARRYGPLTPGRLYVPVDVPTDNFHKPRGACNLAYSRIRSQTPEGEEATSWEAAWHCRGAVSGDSLTEWLENIRSLNSLIGLWEAISQHDKSGIERYARLRDDDGKRILLLRNEFGTIYGPLRFKPDSELTLEMAGEHALLSAISSRIRYTNSIDLFPPNSRNSRKVAVVPHTLRDAIWLQFGLSVIEYKKYRTCEICGQQFEVSLKVANKNKTLCGAACKARAHRQRREQALDLASKGFKAQEISERVGSQLSTIKKWLSERKE